MMQRKTFGQGQQAWSKDLRERRIRDLEPEEAQRAQYGEWSDGKRVSVGK